MINGRPLCAGSCHLTITMRRRKLVDVFSYAHEVPGHSPHLRRHGMVRWVHEHNIGASLASPRVSQSSLYLFPDHCPSCGRLGSEGMLGATSSLGYATGQDDEPPDSSPQQRVGCTWCCFPSTATARAATGCTSLMPLLPSLAIWVCGHHCMWLSVLFYARSLREERERVGKRDGGATLKIRNESGTAVRHNCLDI